MPRGPVVAPLSRPDPRTAAPALAAWGWTGRVAAMVADADPAGELVPGRVRRVDNTHVLTETPVGPVAVALAGATIEESLTTGDWVLLAPTDETVTEPFALAGALPRWSSLSRIDAQGRREQVLAADVDVVLVTHGADRPLRVGRIERTMALAWDGGARPVVVVAKADAVAPDRRDAVVGEVAEIARAVDVIVTSARTGEGIDELRAVVGPGVTAALLGESGAGKSSLVNALVGVEVQATGAVREGDAKGRHTTVTRDLVAVPGGGVLLDTPGLRAVGLFDAEEGVAAVFDDIEALAEACRFRDCAHRREPDCAVRAAVDDGRLDRARLDRYLALQDELAAGARSRVETERERKRTGRILSRAVRQHHDLRPGGRRDRG